MLGSTVRPGWKTFNVTRIRAGLPSEPGAVMTTSSVYCPAANPALRMVSGTVPEPVPATAPSVNHAWLLVAVHTSRPLPVFEICNVSRNTAPLFTFVACVMDPGVTTSPARWTMHVTATGATLSCVRAAGTETRAWYGRGGRR